MSKQIIFDNSSLLDIYNAQMIEKDTGLPDSVRTEYPYMADYKINIPLKEILVRCPGVIDYLYGIVLWDGIFVVYKTIREHYHVKEIAEVERYSITPLSLGCCFQHGLMKAADLLLQQETADASLSKEQSYKMRSVLYYLLLSHNIGCDVVLSKDKMDLLSKFYPTNELLRKSDLIKPIDKCIEEKYNEINNCLGGNFLRYKSPVLVDYICRDCKTLGEAIERAKELRRQKNISDYRKSMDQLIDCVKNGNVLKLKSYLNDIEEIANDVVGNGKEMLVDLSIAITPALTLKDISFWPKICNVMFDGDKNDLHLSFLTELIKYAFLRENTN